MNRFLLNLRHQAHYRSLDHEGFAEHPNLFSHASAEPQFGIFTSILGDIGEPLDHDLIPLATKDMDPECHAHHQTAIPTVIDAHVTMSCHIGMI